MLPLFQTIPIQSISCQVDFVSDSMYLKYFERLTKIIRAVGDVKVKRLKVKILFLFFTVLYSKLPVRVLRKHCRSKIVARDDGY